MNTGNEKQNERGRKILLKVDERLQRLFTEVSLQNGHQFIITEGLRTKERQLQLFNTGASKLDGQTPSKMSEHQVGRAIDVAMWDSTTNSISWAWPPYYTFATYVKMIAARLSIPIEWGGDWKTFKDGPHFQLKKGT